MTIKEYLYKGKLYQYNLLSSKEFNALIDKRLSQFSWIRRRLTRGFSINREIYIRENVIIGLERLILHEIGHVLGYKHTWKPILMNPYWIFRWFKRF